MTMSCKNDCTPTARAVGVQKRTGGGTRTPGRRIWNPMLYQLSYTRKPSARIGMSRDRQPQSNGGLVDGTL